MPLHRGVALELESTHLQEPVDVVLDDEGDENHAGGGLKSIAVLDGLGQLRHMRHELAPSHGSSSPSQRGLHLLHGRNPDVQGVVRSSVLQGARDGSDGVLHESAQLVAGFGLADELPGVLPELAGIGAGDLALQQLQGSQDHHAQGAQRELLQLLRILQRREEGLRVSEEWRGGEELGGCLDNCGGSGRGGGGSRGGRRSSGHLWKRDAGVCKGAGLSLSGKT
mmetsp:Transcript_67390/g.146700  ORF Transcript_67390/g.146700 Transcript_67390/m.146700 type:complete len:224 (+) Transcript_67390:680-1351(+)